ncbi:MAG: VOC family protein [Paludibacter sp.]|jgi:lactoylglutathione lyase|nr:VOC family protein [Paludibacter sp.]
MKLEHIAIWTDNIELLRNYYVSFFDGQSNEMYINPKTQFQSYFISFESGARLEIMSMPNIPDNTNDTINAQHKGIIHIAFSVDTKQEVDAKAALLQANGLEILNGPRVTGDGYYEFVTLDPDKNRLEVITRNE